MHLLFLAIAITSFFGIMLFLNRSVLLVPVCFLPSVSAAFLICVLFFTSCLNLWGEAVLLIQLFGVGYALYFLFLLISRKVKIIPYITPPIVFFALAVIFCIIFLRDAYYINSDVYSHWGRIVKEVLSFEGFPTSHSTISHNRDYPVGAALFITYIIRFSGYSNTLAIIAQSVLASALFSAFFADVKWSQKVSLIVRIILFVLFLGAYTSTIHDLMIDYVVSAAGAAMLILLSSFWSNKENQKAINLIWIMPLVSLPILLKSSGIIFTILGIVLVVFLWLKNHEFSFKKSLRLKNAPVGFLLLLPAVIMLLWDRYVHHTWLYSGASAIKFELSLAGMYETFLSKPSEMQQAIVSDTLVEMVSNPHNLYLFLPLAIFIATILFKKNKNPLNKTYLIIGTLSWMLYHVGYILMMLFLMPAGEVAWSSTLGYFRYVGMVTVAISIWFFGLLLNEYAASPTLKQSKRETFAAMASCVFCVVALQNSYNNVTFINMSLTDAQLQRQHLDAVASIAQPYYTRADELIIYSGDFTYSESVFNNDTYATIFLTTNTACLSNTQIEGGDIYSAPGKIEHYFSAADYFIIAQSDDGLIELLSHNNISIDDINGTMFEIVTSDTNNIHLVKIV